MSIVSLEVLLRKKSCITKTHSTSHWLLLQLPFMRHGEFEKLHAVVQSSVSGLQEWKECGKRNRLFVRW